MVLANFIVSLLLILLTISFFTLFERKIMGLVHSRVGPSKVSLLGILQPLMDGVKLLSKSSVSSSSFNSSVYFFSPFSSLVISLLLWFVLPLFWFCSFLPYSLLIFMVMCSVMVYPVLLSGWSSNSKYSFIGCIRSVAQSISYEAVFTTLILLMFFSFMTFSITSVGYGSGFYTLYFMPLWLFSTIAETHRAPFDFSESESELVSGFNTEYSGTLFAFIFLSEYSTLLVSAVIICWVFFPFFVCFGVLYLMLGMLIVSAFVVYIRVTYCRYRYDLLMQSAWKFFMPVCLYIFILVVVLVL